ncbi:WH2 domain-containing protein [Wolbachia endosymbiont of Armadillidium arcangelii]|uniref:WH2 domain-containing protein n=1 Tax=Wolbachia endosymbiont of Armadillidium arcangelii TaxID=3158571 RepID=A0AAU7Q3Z8_9RICK
MKNNPKFARIQQASEQDLEEECESNAKQSELTKPINGQNSIDNDKTQKMKYKSGNQKLFAAGQKIDTPILINNSVSLSKATALKYSIATLLLCISSVTAGIYTYLAISVILSAIAVPVLFAVISVTSALVALSSAAYLINLFVSAVNSERKIDLSEKKPDSELGGNEKCKVPEEQQQKNNDNAAEMQPVTKVPTAPNTKNGNNHSALFQQIREGTKLKTINDGAPKKSDKPKNDSTTQKNAPTVFFPQDLQEAHKKLKKVDTTNEGQKKEQLTGVFNKISAMIPLLQDHSNTVSSNRSEEYEQDWSDNKSTYSTPLNSQLDNKKRRYSSDSGHGSDDNEKSKPTSPLHSVPKAGKSLVPPKTAGLQTKSEASPAAQANNVDPVNSEVQKPSSSISQKIKIFGGKADKRQVQSVIDRGKSKLIYSS